MDTAIILPGPRDCQEAAWFRGYRLITMHRTRLQLWQLERIARSLCRGPHKLTPDQVAFISKTDREVAA